MTRNLTDKQLAIRVNISVVYKDRVYSIYFLFIRVNSTSVTKFSHRNYFSQPDQNII